MRLNPKKTTTATTGVPPPQGEAEGHHPVTPDDNGPSSQPLVLHRQQALSQHSAAGDVIDLTKRLHKQKGKKEDEVSRRDDLSPEARTVLRGLARTFVESCFNRAYPFISFLPPCPYSIFPRILFAVTVDNWGRMSQKRNNSMLIFRVFPYYSFPRVFAQGHQVGAPKDYRERSSPPALRHKVVPRVLPCRSHAGERSGCITRVWAMGIWPRWRGHRARLDRMGAQAHERRRRRKGKDAPPASYFLPVTDSRAAQPKLWTELQAGIECLTQLLALLEAMAGSSDGANTGSEELHEAAVLLQQQLVYNGQVLDAALDALRAYKDGTQSLAFLRAGVHLAYAVMRMLEKWARTSGEGSYVRKRAKPKPKRKRVKATGTVFFFFAIATHAPMSEIYLFSP